MARIIVQTKTGGNREHPRDRNGENHGGTDGDTQILLHRRGGGEGPWVNLDNPGDDMERGDFDSYTFNYPFGVSNMIGATWRIRPAGNRSPSNRFLDHWHLVYFNIVEEGVGILRFEPNATLFVDIASAAWRYYCFGGGCDTIGGGIFEDPPTDEAAQRIHILSRFRTFTPIAKEDSFIEVNIEECDDPFQDLREKHNKE